MKARWKATSEKVATLSQREKILLLISGLIIIPGMIDFFMLQPLRDSTIDWNNKSQSINERMQSFADQQKELLEEINNDPAMELERRIEGLSQALEATKGALVSYTDSLISPQKMAYMLENMIHEKGSLQLVSLENLPVESLFNKQQKELKQAENTTTGNDIFGLYRHGIRIVFKGNYMATMDYLQNLEQLPWKFYWQNFDYQVEQHPTALITLNIYTLSTSQWWIGDEDDS